MIHVYAFAPSGVLLVGIEGIGGAVVEACTVEDVAAIVSSADGIGLDASPEALLAHGRVVESLRDRSDAVLPVRFGHQLRHDELVRVIRAELPTWRARLAHVSGCVEFCVRTLPPERLTGATSGIEYLQRRRVAFELTDELTTALSRRARAAAVAQNAAAAYLVPVEERPAFERTIAEFTAAHPDLTLLCTGPWAPYSFTEAV